MTRLGIQSLVLGVAWLHAALALQSFSQGCQPMDAQFYSEDAVGFYCFPEDSSLTFNYTYSLIELRYCVGNNAGSLIGYDDGNYQDTCEGCILQSVRSNGYRTCYLKCNCHDMDKQLKETILDLSK
ncbi:hypothetical protein EDB80DRAFT_15268 [Ilyonectria destructans]|nr:hypothetical protein EDB80DRAFT_15268 [Ilyonectria destructans]